MGFERERRRQSPPLGRVRYVCVGSQKKKKKIKVCNVKLPKCRRSLL